MVANDTVLCAIDARGVARGEPRILPPHRRLDPRSWPLAGMPAGCRRSWSLCDELFHEIRHRFGEWAGDAFVETPEALASEFDGMGAGALRGRKKAAGGLAA